MEAYEKFADLTVNGEHDITAKFWLTYCSLVELYKLFSRSVRTNYLNLFIYSLENMIALFFATGHHNNAKLMKIYLMNFNSDLTSMKPEEHGWTFLDGKYRPKWYTCDMVPSVLSAELHDSASTINDDVIDEDINVNTSNVMYIYFKYA